eukprot:gene27016-32640_t
MSLTPLRPSKVQVRRISMDAEAASSVWNSVLTKGILSACLATGISVLLSNGVYALQTQGKDLPVLGSESIMSTKAHGTSEKPVQDKLRWNVDVALADRISNYNRHFAEYAGYFRQDTTFLQDIAKASPSHPIDFYDSVTGALLFTAPVDRSLEDFLEESLVHGWPSFRDQEVHWESVRALKNGEVVSVTGTHLGHNLPDRQGNRYCINLVSVAGYPASSATSGVVDKGV